MKLAALLGLIAILPVTCQQMKTVTGTATYRERIALPPDAIFEATLQDVSRADAPAQVLGTARLEKPGQPPFRFSISYDAAKIEQNRSYAVRATITVAGKLMFTTDQSYPVLTRGKGSDVSMTMRRVADSSKSSKPDSPLRETYWKVMEVDGKPVTVGERQREPNLILHTAESKVTGFGGCNNFTGGYTLNGNTLKFGNAASTMMACVQGMDTEKAFLSMLVKVATWKIAEDRLELFDGTGKVLAKFEQRLMR